MKKSRKMLMFVSTLIMAAIWLFIALERGTNLFKGLDLIIFIAIVVLGMIAFINALKKEKDEQEGLPPEDELSTRIKYKSGYYAFLGSMYLWLIIFALNDMFPNRESMIGGGVLLSAVIFYITKLIIKKRFNE